MSFIILIIITFLLVLSALIASTETAMMATSPGRMHRMKAEGNQKAIKVLQILKMRDKVIATLLIVYNISNILSTTLATSFFIEYLGDDHGTIVSSVVMSMLIIIFAEIIPKAVTVARPEQMALASAGLLIVAMKVLHPVNVFFHFFVNAFCFIFRIDLNQEISGEEEIRGVIEHHMNEGNVYKDARDMMGGILDISNMLVSDIMIHRSNVVAIDINTPIEKLIKIACTSNHTRLPIWEGDKDNIIGILHVKDLLNKIHSHKGEVKKEEIDILSLLNDPVFVPDTALVVQQLHSFREGQSHLACVVNEYGELQGIITFEDILEEIVGQIYDEHDSEAKKIIKKSATEYILDGLVSVRDLNRELGWRIPENEATTIAGFMINELEKIPNAGDFLVIKGIRFIVVKKSANRVKTIRAIVEGE